MWPGLKQNLDRDQAPNSGAGMGFWLWIDRVGGFRVCLADEVTIGQPLGGDAVDIPILGDLSRRHAAIRRDGESYLVEPVRPVKVAGRQVDRPSSLVDGNVIDLGGGVRLVFRRPHPLSLSARLDLDSSHRMQPAADGVVLLAESCVLGPGASSHVVCRDWKAEVVLYRQGGGLHCRTRGALEIDGRSYRDRGPIERSSRVVGEGFSLSLEPIG